jgi:hypothetical protein
MLVGALTDMRGQRGAVASLALGYGIDSFEQSILLLSLATGISTGELQDAVTFCREVVDPAQPRVANQHLVTRSILKNFAVHSNSGYQLREFEISSGLKRRLTSVKRACTVENFIKLDSQRSEDHWGRLESRFPEAIAAMEDASIFSKPDLKEVIMDLLALHFARSHEIQVSIRAIRAPGMQEFMSKVGLDDAWLMQAHLDRFGFVVTDLSLARQRLEEAVSIEYESHTESGVYFRLRIPDYLQRAKDIISRSKIQIVRPASVGDEFLIGDNPLITPDLTRSRLGILDGLPIANATTVIMPLTPHITVALAKKESDESIGRDFVRELNQLQMRKAKKSVFFRPGSKLENAMAKHALVNNDDRWGRQ